MTQENLPSFLDIFFAGWKIQFFRPTKFDLKTLLMMVTLVAILLVPIASNVSRSKPFGSTESLIFSPNSQSLLVERNSGRFLIQRFQIWKPKENNWQVELEYDWPYEWLNWAPNVIGFENDHRIVMAGGRADYNRNSTNELPRFSILTAKKLNDQLVERTPTADELDVILSHSVFDPWASLIDLQNGDLVGSQKKVMQIRGAKKDKSNSSSLFAWFGRDGQIQEFRIMLSQDGKEQILKIENDGSENGRIQYPEPDHAEHRGDDTASARIGYRIQSVHRSAGCRYFVIIFKPEKFNSEATQKRLMVDANLRLLRDSIEEHFSFSENGEMLTYYSTAEDKQYVIRCCDGAVLFSGSTIQLNDAQVDRVAISNDGHVAAVAFYDDRSDAQFVQIWDTRNNIPLNKINWIQNWIPFPYLIQFILIVCWGLAWGRYFLKPAEPHLPVLVDRLMGCYVSATCLLSAYFVGATGLNISCVFLIPFLFFLLLAAIIWLPTITRRVRNAEGQELA